MCFSPYSSPYRYHFRCQTCDRQDDWRLPRFVAVLRLSVKSSSSGKEAAARGRARRSRRQRRSGKRKGTTRGQGVTAWLGAWPSGFGRHVVARQGVACVPDRPWWAMLCRLAGKIARRPRIGVAARDCHGTYHPYPPCTTESDEGGAETSTGHSQGRGMLSPTHWVWTTVLQPLATPPRTRADAMGRRRLTLALLGKVQRCIYHASVPFLPAYRAARRLNSHERYQSSATAQSIIGRKPRKLGEILGGKGEASRKC